MVQLGRTVEVELLLFPLDNVVVLPTDGLYGRDQVYIVNDGKLLRRKVARLGKTINDQGDQLFILDGSAFSEGEEILVSRLPQAAEGLRVEVSQ